MAVNFAAKCVCNSFFEMDASGECVGGSHTHTHTHMHTCTHTHTHTHTHTQHTHTLARTHSHEQTVFFVGSDIDECKREENVCGSFAVCVNEDRGYDCICEPGYEMSLLKECVGESLSVCVCVCVCACV